MSFDRIHFEDGKIYHDYHWNGMQENIDKEIKEQDKINFYNSKLLISDFKYSFIDPLIDKSKLDGTWIENLTYDKFKLKLKTNNGETSCYFQTNEINLPKPTTKVVSYLKGDIPSNANVEYTIIHDNGTVKVEDGKPIDLNKETTTLKLKVDIYNIPTDQAPPEIYDYCLMWS